MDLRTVRVPRRLTLLVVPSVVLALGLAGVVLATLGTHPVVSVTVAAREATTSVLATVVEPGGGQDGDILGTIRETTVEVTGTAPATGRADVPGKAHGSVRIENHWSQVQPLAATTRLLSEGGVLFRTTARVDVPPGGSVDVAVEADQAGTEGNIGPSRFTIVALWVGLRDQIFATSSEAMVGGGSTATVVADADLLAALTDARQRATTAAHEPLAADPPDGTALNDASIAVVAERTLERSSIGDVASTATVKLRATVRGLLVASSALEAAARAAVAREFPGETATALALTPDLTGVPLPGGPFPVAVVVQLEPGSASLAASRIAGKTVEQAQQLLERGTGVTAVRISGLPFWARTLPAADRIEIRIER